jgi:phosphoribosylformimino-5-aminoimidazole carboxamide ribotide isomerase
MIVIPAIDVRDGICLQAVESDTLIGELASAHPAEVARSWERMGFRRIQVMDRDARARLGARNDVVSELLADVSLVFQVGGAISSGDQVEQLTSDGAGLVVLGPRALAEFEWLEGTASAFPHQLIVAARLHERMVDVDGGARRRLVTDLVEELSSIPLAGVLLSPDYQVDGIADEYLPVLEDAADASELPVLVAGGIRTLPALRALQDRGIAGAIVGAALYSGQLDPRRIAEEFGE